MRRTCVWPALAAPAFGVWLAGQVWRDRCWLTGLCFYVPSAAVAGWLVLLAGLAAWRRRRRWALALGLAALGPLVWVAAVENQWVAPLPEVRPGPALRLVHWNVWDSGPRSARWPRVCRRLTGLRADLYVLSEAPGEDAALDELAARLGDGVVHRRYSDMAVLARGSLWDEAAWVMEGRPQAKAWLLRWWHPDGAVTVLAADLPSSLWLAREPMLRWVMGLVSRHRPDFVVGDFNAPRRSRALADLPEGYRHAYGAAGSGWSATWPVPVPLWAIDQCILGQRVHPVQYELLLTGESDHRLQVLDFGMTLPGSAGPRSH